jgi:ubiquinol-cytochrome c reductase cytochrome c subunit
MDRATRLSWLLGGLLAALVALLLIAPRSEPASAASRPLPADPTSPPAQAATGAVLFQQSCASCHGADGRGTEFGPTLVGVGAASADFQLRTGRMPFSDTPGTQAQRKPPAFDEEAIRELVAFVASLGDGPPIPAVTTDASLVPRGQALFIANCAPCHGSTAHGGAVGGGAIAPALDRATPVQVVEAMLTGPGQMPVFDYPKQDLDAVASYTEYLRRGDHPGGFSIGGIGPVPEGFVGWVLGMGLLVVIAFVVGRDWGKADAEDPR